MSTAAIITLAVIALFVTFVVIIYNRLVTFRNRVRNAFAQIDVQLQRRYDLVPNLVDSVKAYMEHERQTLTQVIEARNQAKAAEERAALQPENGAALQALSQAEGGLSQALGRLFALSENYPQLQADQNIQDLMEALESTENRVSFARQHFNDAVMHYNTYREQFPNIVIAGPTGFLPASQLELADPQSARQNVRVSFD